MAHRIDGEAAGAQVEIECLWGWFRAIGSWCLTEAEIQPALTETWHAAAGTHSRLYAILVPSP